MLTQPLKWHGGKHYLSAWIHSLAPPSVVEDPDRGYTHRNIGFAGGLGEFWNWNPVDGISEAVNDLDGNLTNFWRVLAQTPSRLLQRLWGTPLSSERWESAVHDLAADDAVKRATAFFIRYRMSRQGLGKNYATPTRRVRRGMNENVSAWLSAVDGLPDCHERLRRVEIRNMPAGKFISQYDHARALFYLDPPYEASTRSGGGEYGQFEMTASDHQDLLDQLTGIEGFFMLSGYRSPRYDDWAESHGFTRHEKVIDNKASSAAVKEKRTECVWVNY